MAPPCLCALFADGGLHNNRLKPHYLGEELNSRAYSTRQERGISTAVSVPASRLLWVGGVPPRCRVYKRAGMENKQRGQVAGAKQRVRGEPLQVVYGG
ncbi:hypothetical protein BaRGS_00000357, partial [Batillaria attramentaria]